MDTPGAAGARAAEALQDSGRPSAPLVLGLHVVVRAQVLIQVGAPTEDATAEIAARLAGVHGHVAAVGVDVAVHGAAQLAPVHCNTAPAHRLTETSTKDSSTRRHRCHPPAATAIAILRPPRRRRSHRHPSPSVTAAHGSLPPRGV